MLKPVLLGIYSGSSRSGKSTVATALSRPLRAAVHGFADPIKEMVVDAVYPYFNNDRATVWSMLQDDRKDHYVIPELQVTLRHLMQTLGTPWGRHSIHPDIWTQIAEKKARKALQTHSFIFDDMRFPNEYALIKEMGGFTVKLIRPDHAGGDPSIGEGLLREKEFDFTIRNEGTIADLQQKAEALAQQLKDQQV